MAQKRILIVDDEPFFVEPIRMALERSGFEVLTAEDGMTGIDLAREATPDLIILDLMLPGVNGFQVCRLLKFDNQYSHIPIIILSAKDTEKDKDIGQQCGSDLYMTKPVKMDELINHINTLTS
ncbi:MAG: response regulator transcription factor [Fidelibacterota bacterium]